MSDYILSYHIDDWFNSCKEIMDTGLTYLTQSLQALTFLEDISLLFEV